MTEVFFGDGGARVVLDDSLLLGHGGEARVYRHPQLPLALKVFHGIAAHAGVDERRRSARLAVLRERKLRAWQAVPDVAGVVRPMQLLLDDGGEVVGYAMARVRDAVDIAVLADRRAKAGHYDAGTVLAIFRRLASTLAALHAHGVVVGDLNDGNVVLEATAPAFIDADSMQLGGLPCPVAHERFLDPLLYGRALADAPCFRPDNDLYALRVLLFQSLLGVHPYGGVHPKLATLLRRAEASHSVLRGDVRLPKVAVPFTTLPDDMLEDFWRCFDVRERAPLPTALFDARFTQCSCGTSHARARCPVCTIACSLSAKAPAIRTAGSVHEEVLARTRGLVLDARAFGGHVAFLVEEDGCVRREHHDSVFVGARPAGLVLAIADTHATWIAHGSSLVKVVGEQVVDRAHTSTARGMPLFACGPSGLWLVEDDALLHHESRARVGRLLTGQTQLASATVGGIGFWRAGGVLRAFAFDGSRSRDVELPDVAGKIVDLRVTFDDDGGALLGLASDVDGRRVHTLALVSARGHLRASISGAPDAAPILESISGKAMAHGRIVSVSNEGLVAIDVDDHARQLHTGGAWSDTGSFVDASVELLPGVGGSIVVVAPQAITRLRLDGRSLSGR